MKAGMVNNVEAAKIIGTVDLECRIKIGKETITGLNAYLSNCLLAMAPRAFEVLQKRNHEKGYDYMVFVEVTEPKKTEEEIEDLKAQWLADPIWDIEDTEGFEAHYGELKMFSQKTIDKWHQEHKNKINLFSEQNQCSVELAEWLIEQNQNLREEIERLKKRIVSHENNHITQEYILGKRSGRISHV